MGVIEGENMQTGKWAFLILAASVAVALSSGCAFVNKDNRRLLNKLDKKVADTFVTNSRAGRIASAPVAIPVGLAVLAVDVLVVQPAYSISPAAKDTYEALWQNPEGSDFRQAMTFIPKVVATPVLCVSDWLYRSFLDWRL